MSIRTSDARARSRAEARRRARLAARGEATDAVADPEPASAPAAQREGGFLQRLFPSAPPLANRPDPLAGFDRDAPLRPVRERMFLLRRHPLAWLLPVVIAYLGYFGQFTGGSGPLGLIGMFLTFGSIIAAGWIGWERPGLFGTVTALLGFTLVWLTIAATFAAQGAGLNVFGDPLQVLLGAGAYAVVQGAMGFVGGWYGGYLRRRQAQVSALARQRSGQRRRR